MTLSALEYAKIDKVLFIFILLPLWKYEKFPTSRAAISTRDTETPEGAIITTHTHTAHTWHILRPRIALLHDASLVEVMFFSVALVRLP